MTPYSVSLSFTLVFGLPVASAVHTSNVSVDLSPSASVTVFFSWTFCEMTRWNPAASCLFDGAAVGFLPDTGRDPAAATDFTSGPAAGRLEGAAFGSG